MSERSTADDDEDCNGAATLLLASGEKRYYADGVLHRGGGRPAVVYAIGSCEYWVRGRRHRWWGPAVVYASGSSWYWHGVSLRPVLHLIFAVMNFVIIVGTCVHLVKSCTPNFAHGGAALGAAVGAAISVAALFSCDRGVAFMRWRMTDFNEYAVIAALGAIGVGLVAAATAAYRAHQLQ